ncbi:hypothetical protein KUCAC02_036556, partial [Chaenocephalus aceratus]
NLTSISLYFTLFCTLYLPTLPPSFGYFSGSDVGGKECERGVKWERELGCMLGKQKACPCADAISTRKQHSHGDRLQSVEHGRVT